MIALLALLALIIGLLSWGVLGLKRTLLASPAAPSLSIATGRSRSTSFRVIKKVPAVVTSPHP
jgi:hypothetical protein